MCTQRPSHAKERSMCPGKKRLWPLAAVLVAAVLAMPSSAAATSGTSAATADTAAVHDELTLTTLNDGRVLAAGGTSAEVYDPASETWSPAGTLSHERSHHFAVKLADGRVLIAGGDAVCCWSSDASTEIFDPATGTWTTTGSLALGRGNATGTLLPDGRVLAVGGNAHGTITATAELYDPSTGRRSEEHTSELQSRPHLVCRLP